MKVLLAELNITSKLLVDIKWSKEFLSFENFVNFMVNV